MALGPGFLKQSKPVVAKARATWSRRPAAGIRVGFALMACLWTTVLAGPRKEPAGFSVCYQRFKQAPQDWRSASCFTDMARRGHTDEAEAILLRLNEEDPDNAGVVFALASVEALLNRSSAEPHLERAAELFALAGNQKLRLYCYLGLARRLGLSGRWDDADAQLEHAGTLAKDLGNPAVTAQVVIERARLFQKRGVALTRAYNMLESVEDDVQASTSSTIRDEFLQLRANIAFDLGRYEDALRDRRKLSETTANPHTKASSLYSQALCELALFPRAGARERAEALLREGLPLARKAHHLGTMTRIHVVLAHLVTGAEREWHLREAIQIAKESKDPAEVSIAQQDLSLLEAETDPAAGEATLEKALANGDDSRDWSVLIRGYYFRMKLSWKIHSRQRALEDSDQTLDFIERLRALQETSEGRLGMLSRRVDDYSWLYGTLLTTDPSSRDFQERAFRLAERSRGRVLLETVDGTSRPAPGAAANGLEKIAATRKAALDSSLTPEKRGELAEELRRLEADWGAATRLNQFGEVGQAPLDFVSLTQVQESLAPDEAMLSYRIAPWESYDGSFSGGAWLMVITRGSVRVHRLPEMAELETKISVLRDLLVQGDDEGGGQTDGLRLAAKAMFALHLDLVAPALAELPTEVGRLLILPDQGLHLLPFGALRASKDSPPLTARFRVSLIPSATLWHKWRTERIRSHQSETLILAAPDPPQLVGSDKSDFGLGDRDGLASLPYAAWEGREIVCRLGVRRSCLRLGAEASESFLKGLDLEPYGILHFAAHAYSDEDRGLRSAVALAPGAETENGLLESSEIAKLDLSGKVIILSSCNTASGTVVRGEGVMSLARAFFSAGSPTVVGSLWRLRDDYAALLFTTFYGHLTEGLSVDEALSTTQWELAAAGYPESAWGCAVVLGDGTVTPFPAPTKLRPLIGLLFGMALLVVSLLMLRRTPA